MARIPQFLMTQPTEYTVSYRINPWMRPDIWTADGPDLRRRAGAASQALAGKLADLGANVVWTPASVGLPDLVFPANAAVVLDGRALMARFQRPERRGEEAVFRRCFDGLVTRGLLSEIIELPPACFQEGAGDAIWDANRAWFWTGWGQRSDLAAADCIEAVFAREAVRLQLASARFYHLDTCFCPLAGGEVLYYPPAFTPAALRDIQGRVAPDDLIEARDEDAAAFCVNAISLGRDIVMARAPARLKAVLGERGYRIAEVDLAPFILSGGAAFCMTLRLDLEASPKESSHERHPDVRALA